MLSVCMIFLLSEINVEKLFNNLCQLSLLITRNSVLSPPLAIFKQLFLSIICPNKLFLSCSEDLIHSILRKSETGILLLLYTGCEESPSCSFPCIFSMELFATSPKY